MITILLILGISLIVMTLLVIVHTAIQVVMGYRWYYRHIYLWTPHWRFTRQVKFLFSGKRCRICGATHSLDVHHREYTHKWWEWLYLGDLEVLCRQHHIAEHGR